MSYTHFVNAHTNVSELFGVVAAHPEGVVFTAGGSAEKPDYTYGYVLVKENPGDGQRPATKSILNNVAYQINLANKVVGERTASSGAASNGEKPAEGAATKPTKPRAPKSISPTFLSWLAEFNENGTANLEVRGQNASAKGITIACFEQVEGQPQVDPQISMSLGTIRWWTNAFYQLASDPRVVLAKAIELRNGNEVKPGFQYVSPKGATYAAYGEDKAKAKFEITTQAVAATDTETVMALMTGAADVEPIPGSVKAEWLEKWMPKPPEPEKPAPTEPSEKPADNVEITGEGLNPEVSDAANKALDKAEAEAKADEQPAPVDLPKTEPKAEEPAAAAPAKPYAKGTVVRNKK